MNCAVLFARAPEPGRVKTRLQSHLTPKQAAALYEAFLRDCAAALAASGADRRVVAAAEADGLAALRDLLDDGSGRLQFTTQHAGELGQRMAGALREAFAGGGQRAVLVGSDSPSLPAGIIDQALAALDQAEVVLGPSTDGGYYLVGVAARSFEAAAPALFEGIEWGTGQVLERTVAALPTALRLALLAPWYDVDLPHEAAFLRIHLEALRRAGTDAAPHSRRALRDLSLPPPS